MSDKECILNYIKRGFSFEIKNSTVENFPLKIIIKKDDWTYVRLISDAELNFRELVNLIIEAILSMEEPEEE